MYQIVDTQTGIRYRKLFVSLARAQRRADALDLEYGAVRYVVRYVSVGA